MLESLGQSDSSSVLKSSSDAARGNAAGSQPVAFKSVQSMNWAWQFWDRDGEKWVQIPCVECLKLEFDY